MTQTALCAGGLSMVALVALGCGEPSEHDVQELEAQLIAQISRATDSGQVAAHEEGPPFQSALEACYAESAPAGLEVHTLGRYLALGERMMAVRVSMPRAPRLARCIEDAVMRSAPPGWQEAPDALGCGSFAIDLGGPPPPVRVSDIARQYEEHQRGMAALMREVAERGLLPADHPLVREALSQQPR